MGLDPETFWSMSLVEWRAALAGFAQRQGHCRKGAAEGMRRSELETLMRQFPDG